MRKAIRTPSTPGREFPAGPIHPTPIVAAASGEGVLEATAVRRPSAPRRTRVRPDERSVEIGTPRSGDVATETTVETATADDAASVVRRRGISLETALYGMLLTLAFVSRFWNLGYKALHHDESLHAYYSWIYETGGGYRHDPLMHGPFLFHLNALVYLLVGVSNASSRYGPAIFGVALVAVPYLLRGPRHLGRWGALAASTLFLVSPTILYQSRYIRHDIYTVVGALLLFAAIVRYLERPERRWLVVAAASGSALLTNHEVIFALIAIFAAYLYGAFMLERMREWWPTRRDLARKLLGLHAGVAALLLGVYVATPKSTRTRLLDIPWNNPTTREQSLYFRHLISNPFIIGVLSVLAAFVVGLSLLMSQARRRTLADDDGNEAAPALGIVGSGLHHASRDHAGLAVAAVVAVGIFVTLFTSLFTNLYGLVSSTVATDGTLLYWLGQHDVRRGEQPWFYFILLMPQYEFVAVLLASALSGLTIVRAIGALTGRWSGGRNLFFRLFIVVWLVGIFVGLSIGGEKMPWLVVHIAEPAILLSAVLIGGLIERGIEAARIRRLSGRSAPGAFAWPEWSGLAAMLAAGSAWLILAGRLSFGQFEQNADGDWGRSLTSYDTHRWWLLALPPLAAVGIVLLLAVLRGTRRAGLVTLFALVIGLTSVQIHTGWRLSYVQPDVPTEMMIYTQTSPDVTRMVTDITQMSYDLTGSKEMPVWFDSGVSWPMQWYLRDFPKKRYFGDRISAPPENAPVLLVSNDHESNVSRYMAGYIAQEYVLRWNFPEELYRNFAIAPEINVGRSAWKSADDPHGIVAIAKSVWASLHTLVEPKGQQQLYRLVVYPDIEQKLGSYNFKIYVRNDLLPLYNQIRYGDAASG